MVGVYLWVRRHIVPLAFLAGAGGLLATSTAAYLSPGFQGLFSPGVGAVLGVLYLLLGGVYEWTIQKEIELEEWYREQQEALDQLKDASDETNNSEGDTNV